MPEVGTKAQGCSRIPPVAARKRSQQPATNPPSGIGCKGARAQFTLPFHCADRCSGYTSSSKPSTIPHHRRCVHSPAQLGGPVAWQGRAADPTLQQVLPGALPPPPAAEWFDPKYLLVSSGCGWQPARCWRTWSGGCPHCTAASRSRGGPVFAQPEQSSTPPLPRPVGSRRLQPRPHTVLRTMEALASTFGAPAAAVAAAYILRRTGAFTSLDGQVRRGSASSLRPARGPLLTGHSKAAARDEASQTTPRLVQRASKPA